MMDEGDRPDRYDLVKVRLIIGERLAAAAKRRAETIS